MFFCFFMWPSWIKPEENIREIQIGNNGRWSVEHSSLSRSCSFFAAGWIQLVTGQGVLLVPIYQQDMKHLIHQSVVVLQCFHRVWTKTPLCSPTRWILLADLSVCVWYIKTKFYYFFWWYTLNVTQRSVWIIHHSSISWAKNICLKRDRGPYFLF